MRITISPTDSGACGFYRMMLPFGFIALNKTHDIMAAESEADPAFEGADVSIFQRVHTTRVLNFLRTLKAKTKAPKILIELDDDLIRLPATNPWSKQFGPGKEATENFKEAARLADGLIVSTQSLAELYAPLNANITVCPNMLEDGAFNAYRERIPTAPYAKRLGQVRIGYAGSESHLGDMLTVVKPLTKLMRSDSRVRLVLLGGDFRKLFPADVQGSIQYAGIITTTKEQVAEPAKNINAIMPRYYAALEALDFDIGLAPLQRQVFNLSKSAIKSMEYGQAGIAVVATRYGPYADYAELHPDAIVAVPPDDERAWLRELTSLVNDASRRAELVEKNREAIARTHLISCNLGYWERALESVAAVAA